MGNPGWIQLIKRCHLVLVSVLSFSFILILPLLIAYEFILRLHSTDCKSRETRVQWLKQEAPYSNLTHWFSPTHVTRCWRMYRIIMTLGVRLWLSLWQPDYYGEGLFLKGSLSANKNECLTGYYAQSDTHTKLLLSHYLLFLRSSRCSEVVWNSLTLRTSHLGCWGGSACKGTDKLLLLLWAHRNGETQIVFQLSCVHYGTQVLIVTR